jgi:hypothetical protein
MSVKTMCEILDVSPSGYYASQKREPHRPQINIIYGMPDPIPTTSDTHIGKLTPISELPAEETFYPLACATFAPRTRPLAGRYTRLKFRFKSIQKEMFVAPVKRCCEQYFGA